MNDRPNIDNTSAAPEFTEEYERSFCYDAHADMTMCGTDGSMTPFGWQRLVVGVIEQHLENIGMGEEELLERLGMSWILLSTHLEIYRPIKLGEHLTARTWNSGITPPIFRRELELVDPDGKKAAVGATFSTLLSVKDRRVCTDRATINGFGLPRGERLFSPDRHPPRGGEYTFTEERIARPSMTDSMGHVNNTRYGEFVFDALTDRERASMSRLEKLDVWFAAEICAGDCFRVERTEHNGAVTVRGMLMSSGAQSFLMRLRFGE